MQLEAFTIITIITMLATATGAWRAAPLHAAVTLTVNTGTTYQTIEGWYPGVSKPTLFWFEHLTELVPAANLFHQ